MRTVQNDMERDDDDAAPVDMLASLFEARGWPHEYVGDDEASAGLVRCGYLIAAPEGERLEALRASLAHQQASGIPLHLLDAGEAKALLPIARFDDAALIGYEPEAGFADAHLVASAFARGARTLATLLGNGIPLLHALEVAAGDQPADQRVGRLVAPDLPQRDGGHREGGERQRAEQGRAEDAAATQRRHRRAHLVPPCGLTGGSGRRPDGTSGRSSRTARV